jgi:hypothetical protein
MARKDIWEGVVAIEGFPGRCPKTKQQEGGIK